MLKKMMRGFIKINETVVPSETFASQALRHLKTNNLVCDGVEASTDNPCWIKFANRQETNSFQTEIDMDNLPSEKSSLIHPMDLMSSKRRTK